VDTTGIKRAGTLSRRGLVAVAVAGSCLPVHAGVLDFLVAGNSNVEQQGAPGGKKRRLWSIGDFTEVRVVKAEAGAAPNAHPAAITAEAMRRLLADVRTPRGEGEPLFHPSELDDVIGPTVQALALAGPDEDVLLLSSSRRGAGLFGAPSAITARLFVIDAKLDLIVHDSRYAFYNEYRGSGRNPVFTFGSRSVPGPASIGRAGATLLRGDWIEMALAPEPVPLAPATATRAEATPRSDAAPSPAPPTAPVTAPRSAARGTTEEIEQRLITLKRLRDKGLISEAEYNEKRREILQSL
jgi:Short C-terminal domain